MCVRERQVPLPSDCADAVETLEGELDVAERLIEDLTLEAYGEQPEWPTELPLELTPEGFTDQVERAAERCVPGTLVDVECTEPPCLAVFRPQSDDWWNRFVNECEGWAGPYGSSVTALQFLADCPDGSVEAVVMLGATELSEQVDEALPEGDFSKRLDQRRLAVEQGWVCQPVD